jgi:hypothetical protein
MKPISWTRIKEALRQVPPPMVSPAPAAEFWADFKARARMYPPLAPAPEFVPNPLVMRWAMAAAAVLVLAGVLVGGALLRGGNGGGTVIKSLDVVASHSAVLIMSDEAPHATILWIADMVGEDDGDST